MDALDLLREHPGFAVYATILLVGSLGALVVAMSRIPTQLRIGLPGVRPWSLSTSDFILFGCLFLLWYIFASSIAAAMIRRFTPAEAQPSVYLLSAAQLLLHVGLIVLFWRWRELHRTLEERPLNTRALGFWPALRTGIFLILATYPIIVGLAFAWEGLLNLGQRVGLNIHLAPQDAIELFRETRDPFGYVALGFVAVIVAPVAEELVFRAGFYRWLAGRLGRASGVVLSGLVFGFLHGNLLGFVPLAALGMIFCFAYEFTGNLKVPIVMHALFNLNTLVLLLFSRNIGAAS